MKNILLIRHGQSDWNKLNLFTGFKNIELSEQGIEEANKAGQNFKNLDIKFKNAGLSRQKISYINGIIFNQDLKKTTRRKLKSLSSEEYFNLLINIKGIGPWSIEMSRIFFIGDPDIFSILDLGLKNAHLKLFSLKNYNQDFYYQFSPYRSYMCLFLWRVLEDENVTI